MLRSRMACSNLCGLWRTVPSLRHISGSRFVSRIYEGIYHVIDYIRERAPRDIPLHQQFP
ncbi:hypothetical protein V8D89_009804 [Ganoderma adspersum]